MFFYPWAQLKTKAQQGDLFVCHIVREAKPLFDPKKRLLELRDHFVLQSNYSREIGRATDLGWFLIRHGSELNSALLVKRIIWCVRTILIARSAEEKEPTFSPLALANRSNSTFARELLLERHNRHAGASILNNFRRFLVKETTFDPFHSQADRAEFMKRFQSTSNDVALQTILQSDKRQSIYR